MRAAVLKKLLAASLLMASSGLPLQASEPLLVQSSAVKYLKLSAGRQIVLRSPATVRRMAVVDQRICAVNQFGASEFALVAGAPGATEVTFWFNDAGQPPLVYVVQVE